MYASVYTSLYGSGNIFFPGMRKSEGEEKIISGKDCKNENKKLFPQERQREWRKVTLIESQWPGM
jgi:hypothetical protein